MSQETKRRNFRGIIDSDLWWMIVYMVRRKLRTETWRLTLCKNMHNIFVESCTSEFLREEKKESLLYNIKNVELEKNAKFCLAYKWALVLELMKKLTMYDVHNMWKEKNKYLHSWERLASFPEEMTGLHLGTETEVWRAFQLKYFPPWEKWATHLNMMSGDLDHHQYKWNVGRVREMVENNFFKWPLFVGVFFQPDRNLCILMEKLFCVG